MNNDIIDPYMFHIGSGGLKWYSFFAFLGYLLAFFCMVLYIKRKYKLKTDVIEKLAFIIIPISFLGARIWYVIFNTHVVHEWYDVIAFWNGGIAIQGGIVSAGIIGAIVLWKILKDAKIVLQYGDCIFPFILLGQAIGRWGNFFNMEILGDVVSQESVRNLGEIAKYLHYSFDLGEVYRFPLFLMQFFVNIFALVIIVWIIPLFLDVRKYSGILFSLFFIFSGIIRASMELERAEPDIMRDVLGTPSSFALAIFFIIFGLALLGFFALSYYKKGKLVFTWKEFKTLFLKKC